MISLSNRFVRALWKQGNNLCKLIVITCIFLTEICSNGMEFEYNTCILISNIKINLGLVF